MKLLVRATNWLGDAVMSIPALREIRRSFSGWDIAVLARPWVADLYRREDFCDRILTYDNQSLHAGVRGKLRLAGELRRERFDCALLLQNAFDAAFLAWAARIPRRIGYSRDGRRALLTEPIEVPRAGEIPAHQRYYYLELLRRAGLIDAIPECREIRLTGAARAAESGRALWARMDLPPERWIGVSPGAAFGGAKRWMPERFAESALQLSKELDAGIVVFGSAAEAGLCESVAALAGPRARSLAGKTTLAEFIDLAATCTVYLTNDSGPMHVASALGVPTVAIFGATDHVATGPTSESARIVREPVECSPCLLRECPIDHRCMTRVKPSSVVAEARTLLTAVRQGTVTRGTM